ncbi:TrmH family RNA methyltransferase [Metamycoplasma neophronis]|uniref:RNA methyltransferase n=1 Tax=Metamycoplasma neophronis TaxID=872983 RepID=A0ABY2Z3Z0_9BACT|nr:RNA methyltransferase [Metamycoplasma neophronis]TPR53374.1 RNA methyltransferase [Metamycoplasma neophronis]
MFISSTSNPKIKEYKKLKESKARKANQMFLIEGYHLVEEAKKAKCLLEVFEATEHPKYNFSTQVTNAVIKELSSTQTPQQIVAVCKKIKKDVVPNRVIALNNLQDPGNVGTIIRLAKAFNFDTVIIENLDVYNEKVIRSSQGAFFDINLIEVNNLKDELKKLKQNNFTIYETLLDKNAKKLQEVEFKKSNIVLVMGNEGNGISNEIKQLSDLNVYIPIAFESLNVATAAAIVLNKIYNE